MHLLVQHFHKIIEYLRLERLLEVIWSNAAPNAGSSSEVTLSCSGIVQGIVDISKDENSTTSLGTPFQCLTTLSGRTLQSSYMRNGIQTPRTVPFVNKAAVKPKKWIVPRMLISIPLHCILHCFRHTAFTFSLPLLLKGTNTIPRHQQCDKIYNKKVVVSG